MKQIMTVFGYTFREAITKKAFIISSVIMLVLITVLCALPVLLGGGAQTGTGADDITAAPSPEEVRPYACLYVDPDQLIPGAIDALNAAFGDTYFYSGTLDEMTEARARCAEDGNFSILMISADANGDPLLEAVTRDFMSGISAANAAQTLSRQRSIALLKQLGADESITRAAMASIPYSASIAGSMNVSGYTMGILLTMLIFFAVYFYGYGVSMSVATEKTSRVMETLVVSAKPSRILLGKCLAMGVVGLLQFGGVMLYTMLMYHLLIPAGTMLMGMSLDISAFTVRSAIWVLAYFILGYTLYAMMNAVCGAMVSKVEDLNSAMMPVMMVALISFYLGYIAAIAGNVGVLTTVAMYLPFSSPFIMPFKLLNGTVETRDLIVSCALLAAAIVLVSRISIRVYEASVLHYGNRLRLRDLRGLKG